MPPLLVKRATNEEDRRILIEQLNRDPILNAPIIFDLQTNPDRLELFICRNEESGGQVDGFLSYYYSPTTSLAFLRAVSEDAAARLTEFIPRRVRFVQVNTETQFLPLFKNERDIVPENLGIQHMMAVSRKEQVELSDESENSTRKLSEEFALQYAELTFEPPEEINVSVIEENRASLRRREVYGIVINGKIVSIASASARLPNVWFLANLFTVQGYSRKGYGTLVASALTRDALQNAGAACLYVDANNNDAIRIYERLGYKKIRENLVFTLKRGTG